MTSIVEQHYRPAEVAARLGCTAQTVLRWIAQGRASAGRRGIWPVRQPSRRMTLIPASAVNRFLSRKEF